MHLRLAPVPVVVWGAVPPQLGSGAFTAACVNEYIVHYVSSVLCKETVALKYD